MRAEEEERRRREVTGSARNTEETTIGAGGMLTLDGGGLDVVNGGNGRIRDGGTWSVEGGGSMDLMDDGVIRVNGQGYEPEGGNVYKVTAEVTSMDKAGYINYRSPGLRFTSDIYGADEASIYSREGGDLWMEAGSGRFKIATNTAYLGTSSPDYAYDYRVAAGDGGGVRSTDFTNGIEWGVKLYNSDQISGQGQLLTGGEFISGHDGLFLQGAGKWSRLRTRYGGKVWLESKGTGTASVEMPGDGRVLIKGATDVTGTFTVNGQPVGGGTWDSITGKPSTFPPSAHDHNNATQSAPGFMSPTDKGKLDGATASPSANSLMYRDAWGRAQISDPVGGDDVANKRAVDAGVAKLTGSTTRNSPPLLIYRRNALLTLTSGWLGNVPWDAVDEDATLNPGDPGRMYAPIAGVYQFSCFITLNDPNKAGNRQVVVKKGSGTGSSVNYTGVASNPVASANFAGSFTTPIRMAAGDYLEVVAYQNSGANATFYASSSGQSYNNASMQWLRP